MHPDIRHAFDHALAEARTHVGATAPNPPVGCAILDIDGVLLAVAAHQRAGTEHAETLAIRQCEEAGVAERIHTIVVTLEPCNHTGRQPPCAEAILATSAREVWIGSTDPNPRVAGGGAKRLRTAGLEVRVLSAEPREEDRALLTACERLIAPFSKWVRTGLPWVTVKQAFDLTGSMIPPPELKTFTSPDSLKLAHELRRRANAILTGSGTILADWPEFTVRHVPDHADVRRWLSIIDKRRRTPDAYLAAARERGFRVRLDDDFRSALNFLGNRGDVLEVLVEAGPSLSGAILLGGLWDERVLIRAQGNGERDTVEVEYSHAF
jgi:diaminohydroxyphosphoribosylaminopyrimidine deaminase/5-amino-6-(5-phosphoribosylamino)uracil reductase